jgi:hypothetical protein
MAEPDAEIFTDIPVGPTESIVGRMAGNGFDVSRGVMVLDGAALLARLKEACSLDLRPQWDEAAWMAAIQADVAKWVRGRGFYIARRNYPADDAAVVAENVAALGLTL